MIDATSTAATSEINSVATLLSGVILVQMPGNNTDIYRENDVVRWNTARGVRTHVVAIMPQGEARHLVGPLPTLGKIIRAKDRNPEHANHQKWLARLDAALEGVSTYDTIISGYVYGNQYKSLPTGLMKQMLASLKERSAADDCVTFTQVQELLAHVNIHVKCVADLKVDEKQP